MSSIMTTLETPTRENWAARFAAVAGVAIILVAACVSAFSMLIWGQ